MKAQTKLALYGFYRLAALFGINPRRLYLTATCLPGFIRDYRTLRTQAAQSAIVFPFGPQRIEFNAHRVFALDYFLSLFEKRFRTDQFSYVDDAGLLHENTPLLASQIKTNYGCFFGCAILELSKL